ncbi:FAD-binding oxidoreductase [Candidatus Saccharibacteria bacterium]|nr:FAD-binding oxidoreductase [Candidatus Saccharibacteria bacterium]MBI3338041.1 FAD-binding oxidoreductase [Candidatus Saccharibacteria bacterium]
MSNIKIKLTKILDGDVYENRRIRDDYSHDASMFELLPDLVIAPKTSQDIKNLVKFVSTHKPELPELSITARGAGTDMSGGAINNSIIIDMKKYFNNIGEVTYETAQVQPGVYYRDFESETLKYGALLPPFPASRDLCTVGGMVANNSGGEKSLQYGKTEKFVLELKVIFADGNEYIVKPISEPELRKKMLQQDFEGKIYRDIFQIVDDNYDAIKAARPKVSKDSTGYHLWNVWDRKTGVFDLNQLIIGSQGTLGIVTDIKFRLVPAPKNSGTLVVFLRDIDQLGDIINRVMKYQPAAFEGFDNYTLMLSFVLFYYFNKTLGWWGTIKLGIQLIPDALKLFRGIPKMVLLIEFNGDTREEVAAKVRACHKGLGKYGKKAMFEEDNTAAKARKFWIMRRESFNLLRQKVKDKHTAPFIDDLVVNPEHLPRFLPELRAILKRYKLLATIAGHMGDGNFHVIPLMKIEDTMERIKIVPAMREVNELVLKYGGSLSGEHNDGMTRGPWLNQMYGPTVMGYFVAVKQIFDPQNIFNPHKKTDADWDYSASKIRSHF